MIKNTSKKRRIYEFRRQLAQGDTTMIYSVLSLACIALNALFTIGQIVLEEHSDTTGKHVRKTILFLNLASILGGLWFAFESDRLAPWIVFVLYLYSSFIFGTLLPRHYAHTHPEQIETLFPFFLRISQVFSIFTFFVPIDPAPKQADLSEEAIREMIHAASESETIDEPQKEIIENVFDLDDTSIEEICTHRSQVVSLSMDESAEEWKKIIHENRHTFYPITGKDDDDVIGVLDTRDYFRLDDTSKECVLAHAVDHPLFISENGKVDDVFNEMKSQKTYFAIILDEYGGMTGIVTLHDIIETLLGEMYEPEDEIEPEDIVSLGENKWEIYGFADLKDVQEELKIELPVDDYDTFSGYVLGSYGHIPSDGTTITVDLPQLRVEVKEILNHRVGKTIVEKIKGEMADGETEKENRS